jgi:hypothetical protein
VASVLEATRSSDPLATSTLTPSERIRTALNQYDYAGQDPINGYDLDGNICWHCVGHFIATHKTDIALGIAAAALIEVPAADEALLAGRLAATAGRAGLAARAAATTAAATANTAARIYNSVPPGASLREKLIVTAEEMVRPAATKAAKVAAVAVTVWRSVHRYGR